jgi:hypothetical protein
MRIIGQDSKTKPGLRRTVVYDVDKQALAPVLLSAKRLDELSEFCEKNPFLESAADSILGRRATANDINEGYAFMISQVGYTEAYVPGKIYTPMQYRDLLPISAEAGPWADTIRYEKTDQVGQADWISEKGGDIPTVDVQYDEATRTVGQAGIAYEVSLHELRQSAFLKRPLNERKLNAAVLANERFINKVAIKGDTRKNLPGFLNQPYATQVAVGGTGGTTLTGNWDGAATPDQILADLNWGLNRVYTLMGYSAVVTDLRVPSAAWTRFTGTARSTYSDTSILKFLLENNISKATQDVQLKIGPCYGAEVAGAATTGGSVSGSNSRAIFYVKAPEMLRFHITMPQTFAAPQLKDLFIRVPSETRLGGLELTFPQSMLYMDKVLTAG